MGKGKRNKHKPKKRKQPKPKPKAKASGGGPSLAKSGTTTGPTAQSVAHAILHRWTPMKALGQGWRMLDGTTVRAFARELLLAGIPALGLIGLACVSFAWLAAPSGPPVWRPDLTDPRRLGLLALAVVSLQWGAARFACPLARRARNASADDLPRRSVPWWAPLTLGLLPKAAAIGVWWGVLAVFPAELTWRGDFAFAVAVVPMLALEARVALWPFLVHDRNVAAPGHLLARAWRLSSLCHGRIFTLLCLLGALAATVLWILASLAVGSPGLLVMWLVLMAAAGLAIWLWMFATLAWIHDQERQGPAAAAAK